MDTNDLSNQSCQKPATEEAAIAQNIQEQESLSEVRDPAEVQKTVASKVRKLYNSACASLLVQFGIASTISSMISAVYALVVTMKIMLQSPQLDPEVFMEEVLTAALNPTFLLLATAISYLIANLLAYFLGNAMIKKHYRANIFGKIQMKPMDCALSIIAVIGIQMISALIQTLIMSLTGMTGVDETTAGMLMISDNVFQNILLIGYTVVIAAITEELVCRGVVMKAFSAKSTVFALLASSMLFGIMHGNFNQMLNGFLLGMVMGYAGLKSKSIFLPIILHMCANGHAMLWSFFEYKFGESILVIETVYIIALAIIGAFAILLLILRNGLPNKDDGFPVVSTVEDIEQVESNKGLTWKALIKSPIFWVFTAIYVLSALMSLTAL